MEKTFTVYVPLVATAEYTVVAETLDQALQMGYQEALDDQTNGYEPEALHSCWADEE